MNGDCSSEATCLTDVELGILAPGTSFSALGRFAGQGHRYAEELQKLHERSPAVQELVEVVTAELRAAARVLKVQSFEPAKLMQLVQNQDDVLTRPAISAPMICLTQLATVWQAVTDKGLDGLWFVHKAVSSGLAGHSQGVVSAVALAAARSRAELQEAIATAVTLLWLLGLHTESVDVEGGMAIVDGPGLTRGTLDSETAKYPGLFVAGRNQRHAFVLSGVNSALEACREKVEGGDVPALAGCRWRRLRISAPFHCPLLSAVPAAVAADAARLELRFGPLSLPVFTGSGTQLQATPTMEELAALVCTSEINWPGTMAAVGAHSHNVEFGPGAPLPLIVGIKLSALAEPPEKVEALAVIAETSPEELQVQGQVASGLDLVQVRKAVLAALASAIGCQEADLNHETPFFDLGLRSNDLTRFAGALTAGLGGAAVAAHELFDYPTVEQLSLRIERRLAAAAAATGAAGKVDEEGPDMNDIYGCILWVLSGVLDCDQEDVEVDIPFQLLGLSDADLTRCAAKLSRKLQMQVGAHELTDFPTVDRLAARLEQRLAALCNFGPAWAMVEPARANLGQACQESVPEQREMDLGAVLQAQKLLRKRLSLNDAQADLKRLQASCFPDGEAYLAALQERLREEEEAIYWSLGFRDEDAASLRRQALRITIENMRTSPKLKDHSHKLVSLTWPTDTSKWKW